MTSQFQQEAQNPLIEFLNEGLDAVVWKNPFSSSGDPTATEFVTELRKYGLKAKDVSPPNPPAGMQAPPVQPDLVVSVLKKQVLGQASAAMSNYIKTRLLSKSTVIARIDWFDQDRMTMFEMNGGPTNVSHTMDNLLLLVEKIKSNVMVISESPPQSQVSEKRCGSCSAALSQDAAFCFKCGAKQE